MVDKSRHGERSRRRRRRQALGRRAPPAAPAAVGPPGGPPSPLTWQLLQQRRSKVPGEPGGDNREGEENRPRSAGAGAQCLLRHRGAAGAGARRRHRGGHGRQPADQEHGAQLQGQRRPAAVGEAVGGGAGGPPAPLAVTRLPQTASGALGPALGPGGWSPCGAAPGAAGWPLYEAGCPRAGPTGLPAVEPSASGTPSVTGAEAKKAAGLRARRGARGEGSPQGIRI